ncbi:MAG: Hsp20 family protein [Gaiellaceae bacterium]|jgi:HSP20 family molecular chaperone IbpA
MTALLPELRSVRLRETEDELVLEVAVPPEMDMPQLAARLHDGVLTITLPRCEPVEHLDGFHPDATPI